MAQLQILEEGSTLKGNDEGENDSNAFNFDKWISDNQLNEIADCFIEHGMNTLNNLDMNSKNFVKLMSDDRIMKKQHFVPKIMASILSLQELRKEQIISSQQKPETPKIVFMTENENKVFVNIQQYIDNLNKLKTEWHDLITNYKTKKDENDRQINDNAIKTKAKLTDIRNKINDVFQSLRNILDRQEQTVFNEINKHEQAIDNMKKKCDRITSDVYNKCEQSTLIVNEDEKYYTDSIKNCKSIFNKYAQNDNDADFKSTNETRENEIINTGNLVNEYYQKRMNLLNENKDAIHEFVSTNICVSLDEEKLHSIDINQEAYNNICHSLETLLIFTPFSNNKRGSELEKISTDDVGKAFQAILSAKKSEQQLIADTFYGSIKKWSSEQLEVGGAVIIVNFLFWYYRSANVSKFGAAYAKFGAEQADHIRYWVNVPTSDDIQFDYYNIKFDHLYSTALLQKSIPHMKKFYEWISTQKSRDLPDNTKSKKPNYYLTKYQAACILGDWTDVVKTVGKIIKDMSNKATSAIATKNDYFMHYTLRALEIPASNPNFGLIYRIIDKLINEFPLSMLAPPTFANWNILSFKYRNIDDKNITYLIDQEYIFASDKIKDDNGYYVFYPQASALTSRINKNINIWGRVCQIVSPVFGAAGFLPLTGSWSDTKLYMETNWTFRGSGNRLIRKHVIMRVERMPFEEEVESKDYFGQKQSDKGYIWKGYITIYMQKLKTTVTLVDLYDDKNEDYFDGEQAMKQAEIKNIDHDDIKGNVDDDNDDNDDGIQKQVYEVELVINTDESKQKSAISVNLNWRSDDSHDEKMNNDNSLLSVVINKKPINLHLVMETMDGFNACVAADDKNVGIAYGAKLIQINDRMVEGFSYEDIINMLGECHVPMELKFLPMPELNAQWTKAKVLKEESNALYQQGIESKAIEKQSEAIRLHPTNKTLYSNRTLMYLKGKEYEKALLDCQIMRELDPFQMHSKGCYLYGLVSMNLGKYKIAAFAFATVCKLNPSFAKASDRLSECVAKVNEEKRKPK